MGRCRAGHRAEHSGLGRQPGRRGTAAPSITTEPCCWKVSKGPGSRPPKSLLPGPPEMSPFIHNCFLIAFCQLQ